MSDPLPPSLAQALRPELPGVADEIIAAIGREVADYQQPLQGAFGETLRIGVQRALERFVELIADPAAEDDDARVLLIELGRGEMRSGRSLDALLSAHRIGARIAWERFLAAGEASGHAPATLYRLASAIFDFIDRVSAESVEGFAQERAVVEGERGRRRRNLARHLADPGMAPADVRELARDAGWRRPGQLAALIAGDGLHAPDPERLAARLGPEAIAFADGPLAIAWVPDPNAPGLRAQLASAITAAGAGPAALGTHVALEDAPRSLDRARATHALVVDGRLPAQPLTIADEHLATLLLRGGDAALASELSARALAPLGELSDSQRERLRETLRAWLDRPGQVTRVALELHVHPQTVRYRVAQLRELFGERLDDPDVRFELALALRTS